MVDTKMAPFLSLLEKAQAKNLDSICVKNGMILSVAQYEGVFQAINQSLMAAIFFF